MKQYPHDKEMGLTILRRLEVDEPPLYELLKPRIDIPQFNRDGGAAGSVAGIEINLALVAYHLHGNIAEFRARMRESARLMCSRYIRHDAGEPIDDSFVTMTAFDSLFDALASGDRELSEEFARRIGGRPEFEKKNHGPFESAIGYSLKAAILDDRALLDEWLPKLEACCTNQKKYRNFLAYAHFFRALADRDLIHCNGALQEIIVRYEKECRPTSEFFESPIYLLLCLWGVGAANLARMKGVPVDPIPPLIPADLLIETVK